ncbi:MAG: phosphomannomutase/phosphoglucomutase [Candidatus Peregrinibacteria bacterium]
MLSPHIFRAYDIRGIYGTDFDETGAKQIAVAYAEYLREKNPHKHFFTVALGRDGRTSGKTLEDAFAEGLLESGMDIVRVGMVTSPLLYFATCAGGYDGGVMITASHNPAAYNGFKLQTLGSKAVCGDELQAILEMITGEREEGEEKALAPYERGTEEMVNFTEDYFAVLKEITHFPKTGKLAIDAGNGIAGQYAPEFFRRAGFTVEELYCEVDGNFPHHEADPEREENLRDLKKFVVENGCDLGLAFDGDGDRVGVVDKNGNHFSADLLLLLLARDMLQRNEGATVVYDLKATELLKEEIENWGGKAVMCKTGHSFVEEKMEETEAILGGEVSGHIFIAEKYFGFDDALLAAAKLVEIAFASEKTFTEIFAELPKTFVTPEIKIAVTESKKFEAITRIVEKLKTQYPEALTIDGIRIDFGGGAWGIVRASNTSPYLTTRFEARSPEKLEEIQKIINAVVQAEVTK